MRATEDEKPTEIKQQGAVIVDLCVCSKHSELLTAGSRRVRLVRWADESGGRPDSAQQTELVRVLLEMGEGVSRMYADRLPVSTVVSALLRGLGFEKGEEEQF